MSAFFMETLHPERSMQNRSASGFCAIVLAAGRSSRMGQEKSRLPWIGGKALLPWMLDSLTAAGWRPKAVVGPESFDYWRSALPAECVVLNPDPERGKTTSLTCGAAGLPSHTKWILIAAVDQPRPPTLYRRLREAAAGRQARIIVPNRDGRRGHPVVVAGALCTKLRDLDEHSQGLRGFLDAHHSETYRLPDGNLTEHQWDMNTPQDYAEALDVFSKLQTS